MSSREIDPKQYPNLCIVSTVIRKHMNESTPVLISKSITDMTLHELEIKRIDRQNYRQIKHAAVALGICPFYVEDNVSGTFSNGTKPIFLTRYHHSLMNVVCNHHYMDKYAHRYLIQMVNDGIKYHNYRALKYLIPKLLNHFNDDLRQYIIEQIRYANDKFIIFLADNISTKSMLWDDLTMQYAIIYGRIAIVQLLFNNDVKLSVNTNLFHKVGVLNASAYGQMDCLHFLTNIGQFHPDISLVAIENGHLECMIYGIQHGCKLDLRLSTQALISCKTKIIVYLLKANCPFPKNAIDICARKGNLTCIKILKHEDFEWGTSTCAQAASGGYKECLQYLHENGCPWDTDTAIHAANNGALDCLRYARENGCPIGEYFKKTPMKYIHKNCREYIQAHFKN